MRKPRELFLNPLKHNAIMEIKERSVYHNHKVDSKKICGTTYTTNHRILKKQCIKGAHNNYIRKRKKQDLDLSHMGEEILI